MTKNTNSKQRCDIQFTNYLFRSLNIEICDLLDGFTLTWTRVFHGLQWNIHRRRYYLFWGCSSEFLIPGTIPISPVVFQADGWADT
jgi:hypothetical protein